MQSLIAFIGSEFAEPERTRWFGFRAVLVTFVRIWVASENFPLTLRFNCSFLAFFVPTRVQEAGIWAHLARCGWVKI